MSWKAPGAPGTFLHGETAEFCDIFSPGILTDAWEMVILQGEAPKLPENLEISSGSRLGGCSWEGQEAGDARIRKEKNGLAIRITNTCEVGIGPNCSVFPCCSYFITPPNSQTPQ